MLEMLKKLEIKTIIIIILTVLLVILTIFKPNKMITDYKNEIKVLNDKSNKLLHTNDSLNQVNKKLDSELEKIYGIIKVTEKLIIQYDNNIIELKNKQNEISNRVNVLNADGVASEFTNYIKERSSKGIRK